MTTSSMMSTGAIVGIVIAIVAAVVGLGAFMYWCVALHSLSSRSVFASDHT